MNHVPTATATAPAASNPENRGDNGSKSNFLAFMERVEGKPPLAPAPASASARNPAVPQGSNGSKIVTITAKVATTQPPMAFAHRSPAPATATTPALAQTTNPAPAPVDVLDAASTFAVLVQSPNTTPMQRAEALSHAITMIPDLRKMLVSLEVPKTNNVTKNDKLKKLFHSLVELIPDERLDDVGDLMGDIMGRPLISPAVEERKSFAAIEKEDEEKHRRLAAIEGERKRIATEKEEERRRVAAADAAEKARRQVAAAEVKKERERIAAAAAADDEAERLRARMREMQETLNRLASTSSSSSAPTTTTTATASIPPAPSATATVLDDSNSFACRKCPRPTPRDKFVRKPKDQFPDTLFVNKYCFDCQATLDEQAAREAKRTRITSRPPRAVPTKTVGDTYERFMDSLYVANREDDAQWWSPTTARKLLEAWCATPAGHEYDDVAWSKCHIEFKPKPDVVVAGQPWKPENVRIVVRVVKS